jgi:hypothetical protein
MNVHIASWFDTELSTLGVYFDSTQVFVSQFSNFNYTGTSSTINTFASTTLTGFTRENVYSVPYWMQII